MAHALTCKHCEEEIGETHINVGGPIGSMPDGYIHIATGQKNCEGKDTPAEPAE